jgi:MSHA biogenesis protein MshI
VKIIKRLVSDNSLDRTACTTVLEGIDYKLMSLEAPNVPAHELKSALRWRIKDLIDVPVTELTLDVFEAPSPPGVTAEKYVYVVAAKNSAIKERVDLLLDADVNLQVIDIVEMAQRNIANLLEKDNSGAAILSLQANKGLITVSREGELYFSRNLSVGLNELGSRSSQSDSNSNGGLQIEMNEQAISGMFDQVVLEVQRSLDFYESNYRQAPLRKLYIAPMQDEPAGFIEYLNENLGIDVTVLDLRELFKCECNLLPEMQAKSFLAIGAALRQEAA